RIVRIVVVHQGVDAAGRPLHLLDPRHPLAKLLLAVVVAKADVGRHASKVPGLVVATVEADDRQFWRGHVENRWHARRMAFGHVHCDVRDVGRAEEGERPVAMPGVEPLWLAELDGDLEAEHALLALLDIREGTRRRQKPGWELKEDRGQLAGGAKRLQGASEPLPTLI